MLNNNVPRDIIPTLVVGLGGTGFQIVKRLKSLFEKRYSGKNLPIKFVIIDTDLKSFIDDNIDNNEKCQLKFGEGVKDTLDWAYKNNSFKWLPKNPKITPDFFTSTDQGAGLMRPIGRLYLCKNAKLVYDTLNSAKNELVDLHKVLTETSEEEQPYLDNIGKYKVYIAGSLAGGTGCGTFLDVSVMLSKIFNRDNTNVIGMFALESCYDDKLSSDVDAQNRSKANCYAALKELEFYMSSIVNPDDERYSFNYLNVGEIKLDKKLLDICYLVENKNENGGVLTNIEDIYDLCSLQLFQEIGTKLGSQIRADYANFICKDKDPVLNKDRHFSTFSSSSMEVPVDSLRKYCINSLAKDILTRIISKGIPDKALIEEQAQAIIKDIDFILETEKKLNEVRSYCNKEGIKDNIKFSELEEKKNVSLDALEKKVTLTVNGFNDELISREELVRNKVIDSINENSIDYGFEITKEILGKVILDYNGKCSQVKDKVSKKEFEDKFNKLAKKYKGKKGKEKIVQLSEETISEHKKIIKGIQGEAEYKVNKEVASIVKKILKNQIDNIDALSGDINVNSIEESLKRIRYQANKKYGGNIISREMVSKEFYSEYYNRNFDDIQKQIKSMFHGKNILEFIKERSDRLKTGIDILMELCTVQFNNKNLTTNLIEILKENAAVKKMHLDDYLKRELEITANLAKPFWSAVKNPEVSWTECYYIGAVKDDSITNGFTIKAHASIDKWIRNQTGERARQAKYVETTNPYSIDVIHITMGACASYLPDIKDYKQFYLRMLSSKMYPLHLDERYIGLEEPERVLDELFKYYSLAKAYGVIINVDDNNLLNLRDDKYIYEDKSCFDYENNTLKATIKEIAAEESMAESTVDNENAVILNREDIDETLILGNDEREVINRLHSDSTLFNNIKNFIIKIESKYKKDELKKHKNLYRKDTCMSKDVIAYEKLAYQTSFK